MLTLLLQIQNTFVQCFHQESSESTARDSVTEETLPQTLQSSSQRSVMGRWSTRVALLMLLIGQISAETSSSSNACQDQNALHDRMDAVEKRVDDTLQKLEAELALLLDAVEAPEWSPLLDKPIIDILDEPPAPDS
ncbi:hypothetical protein Q8A67_010693 [Cirrhinus molitorella]|uniref:Placenta-specific protein 9 n=1 Tax=Cirrhinus molitorella TaxID=172907 RepID=A0AA88PU41_9TELE|nr:hypothetical protein Q8A67_010693 [Cirrhinus molitorella]